MATITVRVLTTTLVAATFLGCASGQVTGGVHARSVAGAAHHDLGVGNLR